MMKKLLGNQSGVALMMVMTAILILMAIWGDFTFESKVARIRTVNLLDKTESRLMAETALELAMVRLKLYKEAYNLRQTNQNARDTVSIQLLNQLWEVPFIYPVPLPPNAGATVKASIEEFAKESLLTGGMKLSVQNISNKMNLNLMRVTQLKENPAQVPPRLGPDGQPLIDPNNPVPPPPLPDPATADKDPMFSMEQQLVNHLSRKFREKADEDESFRERYGSVDVLQLVANLKYYMSDKNPRRQNTTQVDVLMDNSENLFNEAKVTPKYGPLASFSEIYLIPGWDDTLVEIIKGEFDVFPAVMIDLNKLTDGMLRLLIPSINDDEIKEFFAWRDNPERPQFFNSEAEFKKYIVDQAGILGTGAFDDLFNKYKAQGIQFGSAPTLFRIVAEGTANNSSTTLVATVSLPTAPAQPRNPSTPPPPPPPPGDPATPPEQTPQPLLDPRIIDLQIN